MFPVGMPEEKEAIDQSLKIQNNLIHLTIHMLLQ